MNIHELWGLHVRKKNLLVFYWFFEKFLGIWGAVISLSKKSQICKHWLYKFVGSSLCLNLKCYTVFMTGFY